MATQFELDDVEEILALMEQWGIAEVHLTVDDAALDLVRATQARADGGVPAPVAAHVMHAAAPLAEEVPEVQLVTVAALVVGVFHFAHRGFPQGMPQVGDQVQAGQILGSIELMHVPTDLVSPVSGTLAEILVDDGAGVEYGQPLLLIRPFEEVSEDEAGMLPPPLR